MNVTLHKMYIIFILFTFLKAYEMDKMEKKRNGEDPSPTKATTNPPKHIYNKSKKKRE